ncbi:PhzF family phenazine biosynthesis protein [Paraconexibacter sp.]|uniref:PhzF family phenazine biosynthesis protein n=1 Tax=Paraconexibacter sp. TaxID=2949640 RepID=UPI0035647F05
MPQILQYAAFTDRPDGGNPAGVVLDASGMDDARMLAVAADLGYSESAFLLPRADGSLAIRYFSPRAEVPFCGHATIAAGAAWADEHGPKSITLATSSGAVDVDLEMDDRGTRATLTSVAPHVQDLAAGDLDELLAALRWAATDLAPGLPPRVAYAGASHPVLAAATPERLAELDYDYPRLAQLMAAREWTTVALVHRREADTWEARNPFPPGGIVEDPATGAAAAALGGYLREVGALEPPAAFTVLQGRHVGRPSRLDVEVPAERDAGIRVTGRAVRIPA